MVRLVVLLCVFFVVGGACFSQSYRYKIKRSQTFFVPEEVEETSGLFFFKGELVTQNDSGGGNTLYVLDTAGGEVKKRIPVVGALNRDWEALGMSEGKLYIGDFGNNNARRKDLCIYISDLSKFPDAPPTLDSIRFFYAEQSNFEKQKRNHDFDCEAMVVYNDTVYLYSKAWADGISKIRILPAKAGEYAAKEINRFDAGGLITDAAYHEEKRTLVLVGYNVETPVMQPFIWIFENSHPSKISRDDGIKINLDPAYSQIEGVTFINDRRIAVTAEGLNTKFLDIAPALFLLDLDELKSKMK